MVFMKLKKIAIYHGGITVIIIAIASFIYPNILIYIHGV